MYKHAVQNISKVTSVIDTNPNFFLYELTTGIPICSVGFNFTPKTPFDISQRITIRSENLPQKSYISDSKSQGVNFRKPLLVRESRYVHSQFVESGVYTAANPKKFMIVYDLACFKDLLLTDANRKSTARQSKNCYQKLKNIHLHK